MWLLDVEMTAGVRGRCDARAGAHAYRLKQPDAFRLIGRPKTRRVDIPAKVDGSAIHTQDIKLPDVLIAVIAHPPRGGGKVAHVDSSRPGRYRA